MALFTSDIFSTLRQMREASHYGGFEFMDRQPESYYDNLPLRLGESLSAEQYSKVRELGILADKDDQGVLLQIFTKPVGDRPTLFLEIIQVKIYVPLCFPICLYINIWSFHFIYHVFVIFVVSVFRFFVLLLFSYFLKFSLFFQRLGCLQSDGEQRPGCGGFGKVLIATISIIVIFTIQIVIISAIIVFKYF